MPQDSPILALETSSNRCLVAVYCQGVWFEDTRYLERMHNQEILHMIDGLRGQLQAKFPTSMDKFGVVGFGRGPGSFTGVRIAVALAQAVGFAHNARLVSLPSARIWVQSQLPEGPANQSRANAAVVFSHSRAQAYYAQRCRWAPATAADAAAQPLAAAGIWHAQGEPVLLDAYQAFVDWCPEPLTLVGDQPTWLSSETSRSTVHPVQQLRGLGILRLVLAALKEGETIDPAHALPEYIAADSPWRPQAAPD